MEEGVGGRVNSVGNAKSSGDAFTKLSFACTKLALQSKDKGEATGEIEVFES